MTTRGFSPPELRLLNRYHFDEVPFDQLVKSLENTGFDPARYKAQGPIEQPDPGQLTNWPTDPKTRARLEKIGQTAIQNGEVAAVVLNGGMATRFGGVAKGVVEVVNGRSFIELKIRQILDAGKGRTRAILMNSFATDDATNVHLKRLKLENQVTSFCQFISLRATPKGELFRDSQGHLSMHAPGHGDFGYALQKSGLLAKLRQSDVKYITLTNVDNLGATLDPLVIGLHIDQGAPMSVELVPTTPGDVGGFPAVIDGRLIIMEAFRLPSDFDRATINVFNTNSFVFSAHALETPPTLDWFAVKKKVDGQEVIQFERLVGQLTEHLPVNWLVVPRDGAQNRFIPIKTREDLITQQSAITTRLGNLSQL